MASNFEAWGRLGSKLKGLDPIWARSCNVCVQLRFKLEVVKPLWRKVGGPCGYVGSKMGAKMLRS
eukprot:2944717-Karenia_brevis.AAC.2